MSTSLSNYGGSDGYKFYKGTSSPIPNQVIVNSDNVTEGSTNLYFTTARARSSISAGGALTYNSTTGEVSYTPPTILTDINISHSDDSTLGSAKSIKTYVDSQIQANDHLSELSGTLDDITTGTTNVHFTATDETKLDGIETSADVTDTANVTSAGALMDSELTDLAGVKGVTISTLQPKPSEGAFVDGDKTKLDGIETGATADQTASEIRTAYLSNSNTNNYNDADSAKLAGIEASATADQTGAEIKSLYEAESDTNAFTDADHTKLDGIESSATANDTDANLKSRANHTGTQAASTISDFDTEVANNSAVTANTAKVTNATHTGDATGSGALTVVAIQGRAVESSAPSDGQVLKWNDSASEWQAAADNNSGGGGGGTPAGSTGQIQFNDGGSFGANSNLAWDDSNNRLGVGTGSPSVDLHISKASNPTLRLTDTTNNNHVYLQQQDSHAYLFTGQDQKLTLGTNNNNHLTISTGSEAGFIGIGTTQPSEKLEIYQGNIKLGTDTNTTSKLIFERSGADRAEIYVGSGNQLQFDVAGSERMRIKSDGSCGIGTTNPSANLHISASNPKLRLQDGDETNVYTDIFNQSGDTFFRSRDGSSNGIFTFNGNNGTSDTEFLRIDSSGNVGIGGSPTSSGRLDVLSANTATDITSVAGAGISLRNTSATDGNYSFVRFDAASGNVASGISGVTTDQSPTLGELSFATTGSTGYAERMRITSSGTVEVNTPSSGTAFVANLLDNTAAGFIVRQGTNGYLSVDTTNSSESIEIGNTATNPETHILGGNCGIGVTSADEKLHVNSGVTNTVALFESTDTEAAIQLKDTTGTAWLKCRNDYRFCNDSGELARIDSDGNVGIGTTAPDHFLEINGGSSSDVLHLNSAAPILKVTATNNASGLRINTVGLTSGHLFRVQKDGTTKFEIDHNGRVGIGTDSSGPSTPLHIAASSPVIKLEDTDATGTPECDISAAGGDLILRADKDNEKSDSLIGFEVDGTERMRIDSDGIVSISSALSAETPPLKISQSGTGDASIQFNISGVTNWTAGVDNNDGDKFKISNGSALSSNPRLTVDSSGDVGIGATPSSSYKLLVEGDICASGGRLHVTGSSSTASGQSIYAPASNTMALSTNSVERLRIDSSGASYFYGQLNVAGGSGTTTNRLNISYNHSNGVAEIAPDSDSGSTELKFSTCLSATKAEAMRVKSTGRVTVKKSSNAEVTALTDGATITPDLDDANNFSVTLGGNRTLANPSNCTAGQSGIITITQDGTGSRTLAYGSYWKFSGGTAPTLTTTASAVDVLAYYVESATRITATLITDTK